MTNITVLSTTDEQKANLRKLAKEIRAKKTKYCNRAEIHTRTLD